MNSIEILTFIVPLPLVDVGVRVLLRDAEDPVDGVRRPVQYVVVDHARAGHPSRCDGLADRAGRAAHAGVAAVAVAALGAFGSFVAHNSESY